MKNTCNIKLNNKKYQIYTRLNSSETLFDINVLQNGLPAGNYFRGECKTINIYKSSTSIFTSELIFKKEIDKIKKSKLPPNVKKYIRKYLRRRDWENKETSSFTYNKLNKNGHEVNKWAIEELNKLDLLYADCYRIAQVGKRNARKKFIKERGCCGNYEEKFLCPIDNVEYWLGCNFGH